MDIGQIKKRVSRYAFKECIRCGYCCRKHPCYFGQIGGEFGCEYLGWNGKRWECRLLTHEELVEQREALKRLLYIGGGCSSGLNDWQVYHLIPTPTWIKMHGETSRGYKLGGVDVDNELDR